MEIDTYELAWAAGFWDGEGNFGFRNYPPNQKAGQKQHGKLRARLKQVDTRPLYRLQKALGLGQIRGPYYRLGLKGQQLHIYEFSATSFEHVQAIVAFLWKWLSEPKREQAKSMFLKLKNTQSRGLKQAAPPQADQSTVAILD